MIYNHLDLGYSVCRWVIPTGEATESKFCSMNHTCFPIRVPLTQVWGCVGYTSVPFGSQPWQWTSLIGPDVDGNLCSGHEWWVSIARLNYQREFRREADLFHSWLSGLRANSLSETIESNQRHRAASGINIQRFGSALQNQGERRS